MRANAAPSNGKKGTGGAVIVWHDVTDQMQAQQKIEELAARARQQAQELDAVFEAMVEAVMVYDADGNLIATNRAARELYGLDHAGIRLPDVVQRLQHAIPMAARSGWKRRPPPRRCPARRPMACPCT